MRGTLIVRIGNRPATKLISATIVVRVTRIGGVVDSLGEIVSDLELKTRAETPALAKPEGVIGGVAIPEFHTVSAEVGVSFPCQWGR